MIEVRRLGPTIGAEVTGVDVRKLDQSIFDVIYRAWLDYNVICVRDQDLEGMIEDAQRLVKKHPGAVLLAAAALGFVIGRSFTRN